MASELAKGRKKKSVSLASLAAVALGLAAPSGVAFSQANGSGSLQLCPGSAAGTNIGSAYGYSSSANNMNCNTNGNYAFSLHNSGTNAGTNGVQNSTARISGYQDGHLELVGQGGITLLGGPITFNASANLNNNKITGLANGTAGTDAVNVSQVNAVKTVVDANAAAIASALGTTVGTDGTIATPSFTVGGTAYPSVNGALTNLDGRTNTNTTNITALTNGTAGLVRQANNTATISVGATSAGDTVNIMGTAVGGTARITRRLTGVTAGAVSDTSSDAINGTQLYDVSNSVATALGGGAGVNADGSISAPKYAVNGADFDNVGGAIEALDGRSTTNATAITNLTAQINAGTIGLVQQANSSADITVAKDNAGTTVNFAGRGTGGSVLNRRLTGVADGTNATDAVNLGQLEKATGASKYVAYNAGDQGDNASATGRDALAVGGASIAGGTASTAIGAGAGAVGAGGVAVGNNTSAIGNGSVAIGTGSKTTANNAIAIGANSAVSDTAENSVALGTNSTAERASTVSVGAAGSERQITNVNDGTAATDAVNVRQMNATASAARDAAIVAGNATANELAKQLGGGAGVAEDGTITGPTYNFNDGSEHKTVGDALGNLDKRTADNTTKIGELEGSVGNLDQLAVKYDSTAKDSIALGNAGTPVKLSNVANGNVAATSTEAINGSQLHGTAQSVADALGGKAAVDADGKVTKPTYVLSPDPISGKDTFDNVGDALSSLNNNIVSNAEAIDDLGTKIGEGSIGLVQQDKTSRTITVGKDTDGTEVNFAGKDADGNAIDRKLTHVAAGTDDTDAVNVRQLKDAGLVGDDGKLANAVTYDSDKKDSITLGGLKADGTPAMAPVKLSNVADGVNNNDAVNMGQLKPIQALANSAVQYDAGGTSVTFKGSSPVQLKNVAAGTDDTDAVNLKQLKDAGLVGQGEDGSVTSNAVLYTAADQSAARLAGADGTTLDNVRAGAVLENSMQAVNGSQLYGTYQDMAKALGGNASYTGGVWTGPTYKFSDGKEYNNVGAALGALDTRVGALEGGSGGPAGGGGEGGAGGQANPMFASKGATGASKEAAVASGNNSTAAGANAVASHDNSVALGAGSVTSGANTVSVGSVGNERAITNVADGAITESSKEAVNGGQLFRAQADMQSSVNNLQSQINQVDTKVNRVGAMNAAMSTMIASAAGLQTDNRMAIGTGVYRGQTALAIGYQRKIGNRATVTIGGSTAGGSEYNVGVGAGYGW
ncbi:YadA-like family protein [Ralstonia insidiosa]|nr:YadA-like family protein [Ralstonia insidiosa]